MTEEKEAKVYILCQSILTDEIRWYREPKCGLTGLIEEAHAYPISEAVSMLLADTVLLLCPNRICLVKQPIAESYPKERLWENKEIFTFSKDFRALALYLGLIDDDDYYGKEDQEEAPL